MKIHWQIIPPIEHHKFMKKIVFGLAVTKAAFLLAFLILSFSACQTAKLSGLPSQPTVSPTPTPKTDDNINRPVSEPYTGDLSIFEDANRAENLQIDRVMDILKISEGKNVADIGG